jgi:hypothetical protein
MEHKNNSGYNPDLGYSIMVNLMETNEMLRDLYAHTDAALLKEENDMLKAEVARLKNRLDIAESALSLMVKNMGYSTFGGHGV